jgi:hypothetical protein
MDRATMAVVLDEIDDAMKREYAIDTPLMTLMRLRDRLVELEDISLAEMARVEGDLPKRSP